MSGKAGDYERMKLLTKKLLKQLPPLYSQEDEKDPLIIVKFFTPDANWTWFAWEYDPQDQLFFGLVDGFEVEMGYFSLAELQEARGALGLPIERDMYFKPCRKSEVIQKLKDQGKRVWC